jgi:hypothetical protein
METMHAPGRRRLPPVPRPAADRPGAGQLTVDRPEADAVETVDETLVAAEPSVEHDATSDTEVIDTRQLSADLIEAELAKLVQQSEPVTSEAPEAAPEAADVETADVETAEVEDGAVETEAVETETVETAAVETEVEQDPGQQFVARLRTAAADFASAAGAESAVVREAVPPARHRRARCRIVLRFADGREVDVTLLGPAGAPGRPSRHGFDRQIRRWLAAGLLDDEAWSVTDPDAPRGVAVDLTAWVAGA